MQKVTGIIAFVLLLPCLAKAQAGSKMIDSLERVAALQQDTIRIKTYNELTWQYRTVNPEKAIRYGNEAIKMSRELHFDKGLAQAYNDLGIIYFDRQSFDSALSFYNQAFAIRKEMNDVKGMAKLYNKIGILHQKQGRFDEAMDNQHKALDLFEKSGDDIGVSYSLNNIGILNQNMGLYDEAITYQQRSISIKEKIGDKIGLAGSYVNVGNIYLIKKDYPKAKDYYLKAEKISRTLGNKEYLANTLNNIGRLYLKTGEFAAALPYVRESYMLRTALNDTKGMVSCLNNIAQAHIALHNYDSARAALDKALAMAKGQASCKPEMPDIYSSLSDLAEAKGDFPAALGYHKKYAELKDSVFTSDLGQKFAELQTRFESLQKDKQIQQQKFEISRSNWLMYGGLATFLMLTLLGISYYNRYRLKQRALMQVEIHHQQDIATRAVMEAEETERSRIAKDLHDGVGQMMSAAKMNLSAYESDQDFHSPEERIAFGRIISLVDESCKEVRAVSHNMMPNALLKNSLAAAIREFIHKLDQRQLKVHLYTAGLDQRMDSNTETVLYRILQECMNNVIKHSGASRLDISLVRDGEGIHATIEDNGRGFDTKAAAEGIGMKNIRTRTEYLKGTIDIDSAPGKGTVVALFIPLRKTIAA